MEKPKESGAGKLGAAVRTYTFTQCPVRMHLFRLFSPPLHVGVLPLPTDCHCPYLFILRLGSWAFGLVAKRLLNSRTPFAPCPWLATGEMREGQGRGLGQVSQCRSWSSAVISAKQPCRLHSYPQPALPGLLLRDQPVVYKILSGVDFIIYNLLS